MNSVQTPTQDSPDEQELEFWDRVHADAWNVERLIVWVQAQILLTRKGVALRLYNRKYAHSANLTGA